MLRNSPAVLRAALSDQSGERPILRKRWVADAVDENEGLGAVAIAANAETAHLIVPHQVRPGFIFRCVIFRIAHREILGPHMRCWIILDNIANGPGKDGAALRTSLRGTVTPWRWRTADFAREVLVSERPTKDLMPITARRSRWNVQLWQRYSFSMPSALAG